MRGGCAPAAHEKGLRPRSWMKWQGEGACSSRPVGGGPAGDRRVGVLCDSNLAKPQWSRTYGERMQQHTDLARLFGNAAIPLALLAQRTRAALANAGCIHNAQAAIGFSAPLMRNQLLPCWAPKRAIRLEGKVLPREATGFPGGCCGRWSIPRSGSH